MLTKTRMGFAGLTAAFAALLGRSGITQGMFEAPFGSRGPMPRAVTGNTVWPSNRGTFNAGRNAAKRAKRAEQKSLRLIGVNRFAEIRSTASTRSFVPGPFPKLKNLRRTAG